MWVRLDLDLRAEGVSSRAAARLLIEGRKPMSTPRNISATKVSGVRHMVERAYRERTATYRKRWNGCLALDELDLGVRAEVRPQG